MPAPDPIVTPELVETAARALHTEIGAGDWDDPDDNLCGSSYVDRYYFQEAAKEILSAVAPLIDRAARADELRKQAARLRALGRQAHDSLDHALADDPGGPQVERWDAVANERHGTAQVLEACADDCLSAPTEEN